MDVKLAEFVIGTLLGYGLFKSMKRAGISLANPATRAKAIAIMVSFGVVATILMQLTDYLTR